MMGLTTSIAAAVALALLLFSSLARSGASDQR